MKTRGSKLFFHIALIASVIAFALTNDAWAAPQINIKGYISIESGEYRLIEAETFKSYQLRVATEEAKKAISKLKNFDSISGVATAYNDQTLLLESVEFVGLRRLLGKWRSPDELFQFVDYNRVAVSGSNRLTQMTYAISPGDGNSWRLYLTDTNSVSLGTLEIENENARIELFDPETGSVAKTLPLTRVKN